MANKKRGSDDGCESVVRSRHMRCRGIESTSNRLIVVNKGDSEQADHGDETRRRIMVNTAGADPLIKPQVAVKNSADRSQSTRPVAYPISST